MKTRFLYQLGLTVCALAFVSFGQPAFGAVTRCVLAADYADFALHPKTGDIAAIDPVANRAHLYRHADLQQTNAQPAGSVAVGRMPIAICYKRFQQTEIYAVVCQQDSKVSLIDAKTFKELARVETGESFLRSVTASQNPDDPFLYYVYGRQTGAINLRDRQDKGEVFSDTSECAISPDGRRAYRMGSGSPSGYEAMVLTGGFDDEKPVFEGRYAEHKSRTAFLPGPHGNFTASHNDIYTKDLLRRVGSLSFVPQVIDR